MDDFAPERHARLMSVRRFSEVVSLIKSSITGIQVESCYGCDKELKECIQPIFSISISGEAFDAFHNSPAGYRGQYLRSPNLGLTANLELIAELENELVNAAVHACIPELQTISIRKSISASSCKVWVHESDFPFQCLTIDLAVATWAAAAAAGQEKAKWALCAPTGSRIQVKGALLDPTGNEVVPWKKILRRFEIHHLGFS